MTRIPKCRKCGQSIFAHLWLGRTRICIAPIPDDELPATWAGQLLFDAPEAQRRALAETTWLRLAMPHEETARSREICL